MYHVGLSSTALLFFLRVRAVYAGNKYITGVFFILWLSVLGGSLTFINGVSGASIGTTKYCMNVMTHPYTSSSLITAFIFDTTVFMAISWHLLVDAWDVPKQNGSIFKLFLASKYLPAFSQGFIQDGQKYYGYVCSQ